MKVCSSAGREWQNRFITFGVTLDERSEGTDNRIHLPVSKTLYVLQHFLYDMMNASMYTSAYWVMMRCCLRDMLVDDDDDLLATLIVIRTGPRSLLEEDEAMLHSNKDLLLGESYMHTYQGGLNKMFTSHGGGAACWWWTRCKRQVRFLPRYSTDSSTT